MRRSTRPFWITGDVVDKMGSMKLTDGRGPLVRAFLLYGRLGYGFCNGKSDRVYSLCYSRLDGATI